jgi:hypothetical protein
MTNDVLRGDEQKALEHWFVRRGLPNLIHDYQATTDVFTRAAPLMVVLWFMGIWGAFGDRFRGWGQAFAALAGSGLLLGIAVAVNRFRGRQPLQVPDRVGPLELFVFVVTPVILQVVLDNSSWRSSLTGIAWGLLQLGLIWFIFGFGLGAILKWAVRNLVGQLGDLLGLMIRSLPLLLVFTMFLFLNAELWQVADDFTWPLFFVATGGLVGVSVLFVLFRLPTELDTVAHFADSATMRELIVQSGAPVISVESAQASQYGLSRGDRVNVAILATFSVGVQILLIMTIVGAFYFLFGLVTVRSNTIGQWTLGGVDSVETWGEATLFGAKISISAELVKVTGFLMSFTALQFTVSALTDTHFREEFFESLTEEIREALAVRVAYLQHLDIPPDDISV